MPKDDRPVDVGLASLKGKDEPALIEWWKQRFGLIAAIPSEIARVGALTPQLRELSRVTDEQERRKLTRARMTAFAQLPEETKALIRAARQKAWDVDRAVLEADEKLVQELLPQLDEVTRASYPRS
ncbi:MAG: hypothetical protein HY071_05485 [Chloroflexi bacterium]|nr:hypothetical protein [Chloroflexota bacterium]